MKVSMMRIIALVLISFYSFSLSAEPLFKRIVSLGGGVTEIVFALGLGDQVVAVDVSSVYPPSAVKKPKVLDLEIDVV